MGKQMIISISREYGSGGHEIAQMIANYFHIALYDKNLLKEVAQERGYDYEELRSFEELPTNFLLSRNVLGMNNSPEYVVAQMEFEFLRNKATAGESFVVVGRCGDVVLQDFDCLTNIFVLAKEEDKVNRIMELYQKKEHEAKEMMQKKDRERKAYHNHFTNAKWGEAQNYDLCINSGCLGIEGTAAAIENFVVQKQS